MRRGNRVRVCPPAEGGSAPCKEFAKLYRNLQLQQHESRRAVPAPRPHPGTVLESVGTELPVPCHLLVFSLESQLLRPAQNPSRSLLPTSRRSDPARQAGPRPILHVPLSSVPFNYFLLTQEDTT